MQSRILILLDESSSMIQPWASGKEKYKAARELIMRLMDSVYAVNNQVEFGLRVFGHQSTVPENNCYDTKNEVAFGIDNRDQMYLRLQDIHPLGVTPIAFALTEAANKDILDEARNAYSIILITDGGESCGGDLCQVMKSLVKSKVFFKPYIVSLENDPTLKTTYSCMGDFLQVTNETDIPRAVSTIVEAFRPQLKIFKSDYKEIQTTNVPSVLKVNIPPVKAWAPAGDNLPEIAAAGMKQFKITIQTSGKLPAMESGIHLPVLANDPPPAILLPKVQQVDELAIAGFKILKVTPPAQNKTKAIQNLPPLPTLALDTPVIPKTDKIAKLKVNPIRAFNVIFVIEEHNYTQFKLPELPALKPEPVTVVSKPEPVPIVSKPEPPKKQEFTVKTEDNSETTLEVYFTNGLGKFYSSSPQILLVDSKTKKVAFKFFRFVDADGNPDPQKGMAPGVYDLTFASNTSTVLNGITVVANKKNKVVVTIKNTALSFGYRDDPSTPITENWTATVTERNKISGRVQDQKMNEKILYEPGNYHIEINTFPKDIRNVDLDFFESGITIPHPGFAKFISDGSVRTVILYQRLGDKFMAFSNLDLNEPRSRHLQIQPGKYQVHYQKGPGQAGAAEKVVEFKIEPKQETVIEIK